MAFSSFTGLSVNDTALQIGVSNIILKAAIQSKFHHDGIGITEVFSTNAESGGAIIRVPKIANITSRFRQLGAATNGGWFNSNDVGTTTLTEEKITCDNIFDEPIDVPEAQKVLSLAGAASVGVVSERIGKAIAKDMNAGTMAYQLEAVINAVFDASSHDNRIFTYDLSANGDEDILDKFNEALAALDDGDGTYNDTFPEQGRLCLARPQFFQKLRKKGVVIVGGSNYAQDMLKSGAVDPESVLPDTVVGYKGVVSDVAMFMASKSLWAAAEEWLQVPAGYLDNIEAIVCAFNATGRGYAIAEQTKIVDSQKGVGLRIQPLANFGVTVFFEQGIKLIASDTFDEGAGATITEVEVLPKGSQA